MRELGGDKAGQRQEEADPGTWPASTGCGSVQSCHQAQRASLFMAVLTNKLKNKKRRKLIKNQAAWATDLGLDSLPFYHSLM